MACNGNCGACGNCGSCGGCAKALELTQGELDMLGVLAQIPFLPVARKMDDMTPVYLEDALYTPKDYSLILQVLEKKGLIDLDYGSALKGCNMAAYAGYPVHGTISLTARGQIVVELLDKQGIF